MSGFWKPGSKDLFVDKDSSTSGETATGTTFNFSRLPILEQRQNLPIAKHRRQILYALEQYPIVVIVGETGSGKSTQIVQYLLEGGWCPNSNNDNKSHMVVCCTQPRRIAAITLAKRVSDERSSPLGMEVGYVVRFDQEFSPDTGKIKFVTDGILVREALTDPLLSNYSVIMVDEVHERGIQSDVLLGILKKVRKKRPSLRVIICSATIDADLFLSFFCGKTKKKKKRKRKGVSRWGDANDTNTKQDDDDKDNGGVIISIDGRQHPVDVLYSKEPVGNYIQSTVDTALRIHCEENDGDILCFLPSGEDIDKAIEMANDNLDLVLQEHSISNKHMKKGKQTNMWKQKKQISFLPLYASLPYQLQARVFQPPPSHQKSSYHHRRIIFSTNIAETSVTVPSIKFVIDCGYAKLPFFDATNGFERLIVCPISQASAKQRAGRAGRLSSGKCYRLYREVDFRTTMPPQSAPEVCRTNLSSFVLTLKALGVNDFVNFDLVTPPSANVISHALESLYALGAIDDEKCDLTELGQIMSEFPTDPRVARMLLSSLRYKVVKEVLSIASVLQVRHLFLRPKGSQLQKMEYDSAMGEIVDVSGDHVTYVNVMEKSGDCGRALWKDEEECKRLFLNRVAIQRAFEIQSQLTRFLSRYKDHSSNQNDVDDDSDIMTVEERSIRIRKCVTAGFFFHVARLGSDGRYYTLRGNHYIKISASSVLSNYGNSSEYIVFGETYDGSTGDLEVRACSAIQGKWLRELAPHYWS